MTVADARAGQGPGVRLSRPSRDDDGPGTRNGMSPARRQAGSTTTFAPSGTRR